MKAKHFMLVFLCWHVCQINTAQTLGWARTMGSQQVDVGHGLAVDSDGNVYSTGTYFGYGDFNPNIPGPELDSFGNYNVFVQKYDANGNFLWAHGMGQMLYDEGRSIAVDGAGNVYTTGYFHGTVDFDPGPDTFYLVAPNTNNDADLFIQKLDTDGNFLWAISIGSLTEWDRGRSIKIDEAGNLYLCGDFSGTVDFDPGPEVYNLTNASGGVDAFVLKLDAAGNFAWARNIGNFTEAHFYSVAVDASGNILLGGGFTGSIDLDPGPEIHWVGSSNITYALVLKLDEDGNFVWGKAMKSDLLAYVLGINVDNQGNTYSTGFYIGLTDFDPGPEVVYTPTDPMNYSGDAFVLKLDAAGNFVWVTTMIGSLAEAGRSIALDGRGNVYITGYFGTTSGNGVSVVDFDPGPGVYNLSSENGTDIFIQKLDNDGNFIWAHKIGGVGGIDEGNGIFVDADNNLYLTGRYRGGDFDPGPDTYSVPVTNSEAFLLKWSCPSTTQTLNVTSCNLYSLNGTIYTESGTYFQVLDNSSGCDSLITLNLTLTEQAINTNVSQQAATLTADLAGATYQWVDCNNNLALIDGATNQSFTATSSGYYAVLVTENGCTELSDCYLVCLPASTTVEATACDSYTLNGQVYTQSGIYLQTLTTAIGCDSVVRLDLTITMNLNVFQHDPTLTSQMGGDVSHQWLDCDNNFAPINNANGQTFTPLTSGNYAVFIAVDGCFGTSDCYTVCVPNSGILTVSTCNNYTLNGQVYTQSGIYTQTLTNSWGCDSVLTLNLTIPVINTAVSQQDFTLTANATNATYQWVDCNNNFAPVAGATGQSFTPAVTGAYAVVINQNGCVDTSACYALTVVGTQEQMPETTWLVYPNPTSNQLNVIVPEGVQEGFSVEIRNTLGQLLHRETAVRNETLHLDIDLPAGMYTVLIQSGNRQKTVRVVVE